MYQQFYVYAAPDRKRFRFISTIKAIDEFPAYTYGSVLELQLNPLRPPQKFVVVDLPFIRCVRQSELDLLPRVEFFLAPLADRARYNHDIFPVSVLQAA
ncbi:hypothetical protein [Larkinella terrae]|uniref:Uncharacterized protein n=1 Tax=Larkinella terrae TaxID=2025311 RepID=A0A7K0ESY7_9BACT|nr:hypothetical protein [Larkinella terrae]MRS64631.1 hypothetical protein [Larkinella terrae]